jgi:hypothetical protein
VERRHTGAESSVSSIARVSQDDARCDAFLLGRLDLIQSDLWFSLKFALTFAWKSFAGWGFGPKIISFVSM